MRHPISSQRRGRKNRRRHIRRRGESQGGGKQRLAIIYSVVAVALVAVAIIVMLSVGSPDGGDDHDSFASLNISAENAETGIAVGHKIPDFSIRLNSGNLVSAANLVDEGKPAFYYFFATW